MVAAAGGVEVPLVVIFGPEVDFDFLFFARGGELNGAVFGFVESEVGEERFLRQLFAHHKHVLVEAVEPRLFGKEGLEGFRHRVTRGCLLVLQLLQVCFRILAIVQNPIHNHDLSFDFVIN